MAQDFNDLMNELEARESSKLKSLRKAGRATLDPLPKGAKKDSDAVEIRSMSNFTKGIFRNSLKKSIESNPKFKEFKQQETILREMAKKYKALGETEHYETCMDKLNKTSEDLKKFTSILTGNTGTPEERESKRNQVKSNPKIRENNKKIAAKKEQLAAVSKNSLYLKLVEFRKLMLSSPELLDDDYVEENEDGVIEFDSMFDDKDNSKLSVAEAYRKHLFKIAKFIGKLTVPELMEMSTSDIRKYLNNAESHEHEEMRERLQAEIDVLQMDNTKEYSKIYTGTNIESMIVNEREYYDIDGDAVKARELIAARYEPRVQVVAYKVCEKLNALELIDEAVGYGLLYLAYYINKWHNAQRNSTEPIFFEPLFAQIHQNVTRDVLSLLYGGTISGSNIAHKSSKKNKAIRELVNGYKNEYPHMSHDEIMELVSLEIEGDETYRTKEVTTESKLLGIVGGAGEDNADIWANTNVESDMYSNGEKRAETLQSYNTLVKTIKKLFSLKKTKIDKRTGLEYETNSPIFEVIDYKIFCWANGLLEIPGIDLTDPNRRQKVGHTQAEIAEAVRDYMKSMGVNQTFSQSAISTRIKTARAKIDAVLQDPKYSRLAKNLKSALATFRENPEIIEKLKLENEELKRRNAIYLKSGGQVVDDDMYAQQYGQQITTQYGPQQQIIDDFENFTIN